MGKANENVGSELQGPETEDVSCSAKLADASNSIVGLQAQAHELSLRVDMLEARIQATTDLTDDLLTNANTLVTSVGDRADVTMQQAELVLTEADTLVGVYLVWFSVVAALASVIASLVLGKRRDAYVREAVDEVVSNFGSDDDFQQQFIAKLARHPNIAKNIEYAIQEAVKQQVREKDQEDEFSGVVK